MDKRIVLSQNIKLFDENNNEFIVHIKNGSEEYGGSVLSYQINLDQRLINELDQKISKFNKSYNYNTDAVTDSITEEGKSNYAEPIYNAINNLINFTNHLTSLNARGNDAVMDISAELNINVRNRNELETYINDNIKTITE